MKKLSVIYLFIVVILFCPSIFAQTQNTPGKIEVMTLGVFHFNFPNLDVITISEKDKIDVLQNKYQKEIKNLISEIKKFKPRQIFVEAKIEDQKKIDSLYKAYREGKHILGRGEVEQLGFRLAKSLNLKTVECVDTQGKFYKDLNYLFSDTSSRAKKFEKYYFNNPDSIYRNKNGSLNFSGSRGIVKNLIDLNNPQKIKASLGFYLTGHFKYEEEPGDYTGTDFETGRWFNRNLRIYRNVQRRIQKTSNKILVIFGAGHMNILNYLFECSPEFKFVSPAAYLQKALKQN